MYVCPKFSMRQTYTKIFSEFFLATPPPGDSVWRHFLLLLGPWQLEARMALSAQASPTE